VLRTKRASCFKLAILCGTEEKGALHRAREAQRGVRAHPHDVEAIASTRPSLAVFYKEVHATFKPLKPRMAINKEPAAVNPLFKVFQDAIEADEVA